MILSRVSQEDALPEQTAPKIWRSCCLDVDKQAVMYLSQIAIGLVVLGFSSVQLISFEGKCDQSAPYLGLVSFIIGTYVPRLMSK